MLGALIGLLVGGCTKGEAPAAEETKQTAETAKAVNKTAAEATQSLHKHMQEHFIKADEIKLAVLAGDVAQAKIVATWIAEHEPPADLPEMYLPHAKRLIAAAGRLAKAEDPSAAAHGAANLAAVCAQCHLERGKVIEFGAEPEPSADEDLSKSHMARHEWAVTRLWDGVVGGSPEVYKSGAQALSELPMLAMVLKKNKQLSDAADHFIGVLGVEADRALKADTPETRAAVLGDVLSSCGNCHAMLDQGP